jgi:hypothetical protein
MKSPNSEHPTEQLTSIAYGGVAWLVLAILMGVVQFGIIGDGSTFSQRILNDPFATCADVAAIILGGGVTVAAVVALRLSPHASAVARGVVAIAIVYAVVASGFTLAALRSRSVMTFAFMGFVAIGWSLGWIIAWRYFNKLTLESVRRGRF